MVSGPTSGWFRLCGRGRRVCRRLGFAEISASLGRCGSSVMTWSLCTPSGGWACAADRSRPGLERDAEYLGADHFPDGEPEDAPSASPWPLSQPRGVVATSGTTGTPKVIELTTGQLVFSAMGSAMRLGHLPGDRWLGVLPLHHVGGLSIVMRCLLSASTVELHARFEVERVVEALCSGRVTQISLVPTMLDRIVPRLPQRGASDRLRVVGGKANRALLEQRSPRGSPWRQTWGMSETSQAATRAGVAPTSAPPLPFLEVLCEADRLVVRGLPLEHRAHQRSRRRRWVSARGGRLDQTIIKGENTTLRRSAVLRQHPDVLRPVQGTGQCLWRAPSRRPDRRR